MMKKGFTLVEMLIVVVVLVTLMSITFRLSSISEGQSARSVTIQRLQRVENCLSGYMAAFGTYPPVPLHNRRNVYLAVDQQTGMQKVPETENQSIFGWSAINEKSEQDAWLQVRAACEAQPIGCYYPYGQDYQQIVSQGSTETKGKAAKFSGITTQQRNLLESGYTAPSAGAFSTEIDDWREQPTFQFGLLSFILPRYLVMLDTDEQSLSQLTLTKQWTNNNSLPYDPFQGDQFQEWREIYELVLSDRDSPNYAKVANITSQAICARWISNLQGICKCYPARTFYGFNVQDSDCASPLVGDDRNVRIYKSSTIGQNYILDGITIVDGWDSPLYYYSPAPYQTYALWSAGPNKRTFPPWVDRNELSNDQNQRVGLWIEDDIIRLSN